MTLTLDGVDVADSPHAWRAAGFTVGPDDVCRIGAVRIRLRGRESGLGITGWSLSGSDLPAVPPADVVGVPTTWGGGGAADPASHPNGITGVDHVVLLSPDLRRTVAELAAFGETPRRERDGELGGRPIRQVFFRLGAVILEVVGAPDAASDGPATLWGITYVADDLDATVAFFGDRTAPVKDAVQPGRRITTLRHREFDLSVRTAVISPHVR